jgi:DNA-binding transcriptional LysR family regulator
MLWDDLRYVLAVARAGSALRAAGVLGVNQTTVLRRIDTLETALGVPLFERSTSGQVLTRAGHIVAEVAARIDDQARGLESALAAQRRTITGSVRFTTSEVLAGRLVTPCMRAFHALYPGIPVELITTDERLDIARGEADVALRAGARPEGAGIVAQRLPDLDWTVYCSRGYAAERGLPDTRDALRGHDVVGLEGRMGQLPGWLWLAAATPGSAVPVRSNSFVSLVSNLKAGLGLGALPAIIGDAEPELVRCLPPPPEIKAELWLIVREQQKNEPHVRAFTEFFANYVRTTCAD